MINIPSNINIDFIGKSRFAFILLAVMIVASIVLVATRGLNFGIDFTGGILIEAEFEQQPDLAAMRSLLGGSGIGDVSLQSFGRENNLLIRIGQPSESNEERVKVIDKVKSILETNFPGSIDYRKVDYVGPKVGGELIFSGAIAMILAFAAILCYIWLRFEWQYGVGAVLALIHDAIITVGFFSLTQLEFNLSSVAAVLTIIGYSINDSVVIFDRIRENLRKYKKMPLEELLNTSINNNLKRTILTSATTMAALLALVLLGGEIIKSFSLAALFGVVIGTYSSIYIAGPVLIYMNLRPAKKTATEKA